MSTIKQLESEFLNIMAIGKSQMEYCNTEALTGANPTLTEFFGRTMTIEEYKTIYKPVFCLGIPPMTNAPLTEALANNLCKSGVEYFFSHPHCGRLDANINPYLSEVNASLAKYSE